MSDYNELFRKMNASKKKPQPSTKKATRKHVKPSLTEDKLRQAFGLKPRKKSFPYFWQTVLSAGGALFAGYLFFFPESLESIPHISVDLSAFSEAFGQKQEKPKESKAQATDNYSSPPLNLRQWSDDELELLKHLAERKKELDQREQAINERENVIQDKVEELDQKIEELKDLRSGISKDLEKKVEAEKKSIQKLVDVYSNMKPENAAKVIETMDEKLAIKIIGQMKKKDAANIMNSLSPEKSQKLTEKFAGLSKK